MERKKLSGTIKKCSFLLLICVMLSGMSAFAEETEGTESRPQVVIQEVYDSESVPIAIEEEETPLAMVDLPTWSYVNLIIVVMICVISVMLLLLYNAGSRRKRRGFDVDRRGVQRIISALFSAFAIFAFSVTEDFTKTSTAVDKYTPFMMVLLLIQVGIAVASRKRYVRVA